MADYIEREKFKNILESRAEMATGTPKAVFYQVVKMLEVIPAADVAEVKHGYWQVCSDEYEICADEFVCSICKESFVTSELTDEQFFRMMKYCPNCGAKMDGENNGD